MYHEHKEQKMAFEKVEYSFPDEQEDVSKPEIEIEGSSAIEIDLDSGKKEKVKPEPVDKEIEIEVVNDTPKADRNRKVSEPPHGS